MSNIEEIMNDPFYKEVVGKCQVCKRDVPRAESHVCEKCGDVVYCMDCVVYDDVKGVTAIIRCPKNHFIAGACQYEDESDLEKLT